MIESILVDRGSRLYNIIWRGFHYQEEAENFFTRKKFKGRYKSHSKKCFIHAHNLFRKYKKENGIDWASWEIAINSPCTIGDFAYKRCNFRIDRTSEKR